MKIEDRIWPLKITGLMLCVLGAQGANKDSRGCVRVGLCGAEQMARLLGDRLC